MSRANNEQDPTAMVVANQADTGLFLRDVSIGKLSGLLVFAAGHRHWLTFNRKTRCSPHRVNPSKEPPNVCIFNQRRSYGVNLGMEKSSFGCLLLVSGMSRPVNLFQLSNKFYKPIADPDRLASTASLLAFSSMNTSSPTIQYSGPMIAISCSDFTHKLRRYWCLFIFLPIVA